MTAPHTPRPFPEAVARYFSRDEYLMGRDVEYPLTDTLENNMHTLLRRVAKVRAAIGKPFVVTSGYRPGRYNVAAKGSKRSAHVTCEAIDIRDPDGSIAAALRHNRDELLTEANLWMEHPDYTKGWVHLDTRPRLNRVFIPY